MVDAALFSSDKHDWETPPAFFARLDDEFRFTLDACANEQNAKCENYYTVEDDGLSQPWPGTTWCNPPYGREIGDWVRKAYQESLNGSTVVMLIPARTDTAYWHDYVMLAHEIRFVRGRLRFVGGDSCAPFPSAVVVFRPGHSGGPTIGAMEARGLVVA
jgi:site-specific DNA-methyltransferase (adenine-specific)